MLNEFFMPESSIFWFALGIIFLVAELLLPGFIVMFFGIGALVTASLTYFGIIDNLSIQVIIFLATSVLSLFLFRKKWSSSFSGNVSQRMAPGENMEDVSGKKARAATDITPGEINGKIEFNGTLWEAESEEFITKGSVVEIISRQNIKFRVKGI